MEDHRLLFSQRGQLQTTSPLLTSKEDLFLVLTQSSPLDLNIGQPMESQSKMTRLVNLTFTLPLYLSSLPTT